MGNSRSRDRNAPPGLTLRIDLAGGQIGPGKIRLLEQVAATGSIRKAAAAMKMSYRRAWLLLQALDVCFGRPLVRTAASGSRLSRTGQAVVAAYRRVEQATAKAAKPELAVLSGLVAKGRRRGRSS